MINVNKSYYGRFEEMNDGTYTSLIWKKGDICGVYTALFWMQKKGGEISDSQVKGRDWNPPKRERRASQTQKDAVDTAWAGKGAGLTHYHKSHRKGGRHKDS